MIDTYRDRERDSEKSSHNRREKNHIKNRCSIEIIKCGGGGLRVSLSLVFVKYFCNPRRGKIWISCELQNLINSMFWTIVYNLRWAISSSKPSNKKHDVTNEATKK